MAELKIAYKGINRATPQTDAPDGSCQEIINARWIKDCWRPVGTKKIHKSINLSTYSKVWLHDIENGINTGQPNWIGCKSLAVTSELTFGRASELGYIESFEDYIYDLSEWGYDPENTAHCYLFQKNLGYTGTYDEWMIPFLSSLFSIDSLTGVATFITTVTGDVNVSFLKRTMLATSDTGLLIYLFTSEKTYARVADLPVPQVSLSRVDKKETPQGNDLTSNPAVPAAVLGDYFKKLNTESMSDGRIFGSIMYISCYRLFDGSYILPSIPIYLNISNKQRMAGYSRWLLEMYHLQAVISNERYTADMEPFKELIDSICIFSTKATPFHQVDESTVTSSWLLTGVTLDVNENETGQYKVSGLPVSTDFKKLAKSTGWYKIHEFPFEDIVGKPGWTTKEVDTKGFYQDYATRETLPTDQFTHHKLMAREAYVYNDRVHLANIKTSIGLPYIISDNPDIAGEGPQSGTSGTVTVWLKTSLGQAVRRSIIPFGGITIWNNSSLALNPFFLIPHLVGYNDSRAYKMQITVNVDGVEHEIFNQSLIKNEAMNFSYWHSDIFDADETNHSANYNLTRKYVSIVRLTPTVVPPVEISLPFDTNRMQVSEIQNPLVFPAKNSYQIGTGNIIKLCAGSEPLSTGQFGQFPLQCFTSKGIWALEIGLGDVLYTNVLPVNGEVADNPKNVIPVGSGVVYSTMKGLFLVNGRQVTEIADIAEGLPETWYSESEEVTTLLTDAKFTPGLSGSLSTIDFLEYLDNSMIGFDQLQKELTVTNPTKNYSYVFGMESKAWHKVSHSYRMLINAYPKLLGDTGSSIVSISEESTTDDVSVLIISNCQQFQMNESYKRINRSIQRVKLNTIAGKYAGFYLFASNDAQTYQFLTGSQRTGNIKDLVIQRSHGSAKYFILCFNGLISANSEIKEIDLEFNTKWNNRLH